MTHDASHSYTYDAEGRVTAVDAGSTATYYYNAQGYRVHRAFGASSLEYVYDLNGNVVSDIQSNGALNASYLTSAEILSLNTPQAQPISSTKIIWDLRV
jgi:YD repeat-containing protein